MRVYAHADGVWDGSCWIRGRKGEKKEDKGDICVWKIQKYKRANKNEPQLKPEIGNYWFHKRIPNNNDDKFPLESGKEKRV